MTDGIAASSPSAVANSASAMPGATTASEVFFDSAIAWKLVMMPHTVPNRPTNGAVEPTVARNSKRRSSRSISRLMVTSMTFSTRIWMPPSVRGLPSTVRFHSRMAATNKDAMLSVLARDTEPYRSSSDWPDQNICSNLSVSRRARANKNSFEKMIAHDQTEASSSPTMMICTIRLACMNSSSTETEPWAGARDFCITSAGFMCVSVVP